MTKFNLSIGDEIYKFTLQERIGGGNFGDVWLANDNTIAKPLAIKIIDTTNTSINHELIEARIGNRMDHDNLIQVHSADVVDISGKDAVIIAMDYMPEGSITKKSCSGNFVDIRYSIKAVIDLLRGLEYLHDAGFYHNDIKPRNILIGSKGEALLTDYGISEFTSDGKGIEPQLQYQPHKAPETFDNQLIDVKTDIYQSGLTLFRLVNGLNLISDTFKSTASNNYSDLVKSGKLLDQAGWQPFVPNSLKRVIKKATNCDVNKRYSSALEMRRALEKLLYSGAWTCLPNGELQGDCGNYFYRFEVVHLKGLKFIAFKKNKLSGRETKISAYSAKNLTVPQLQKAQANFMRAVVEGKV